MIFIISLTSPLHSPLNRRHLQYKAGEEERIRMKFYVEGKYHKGTVHCEMRKVDIAIWNWWMICKTVYTVLFHSTLFYSAHCTQYSKGFGVLVWGSCTRHFKLIKSRIFYITKYICTYVCTHAKPNIFVWFIFMNRWNYV